ncbi:MAG TPA: PH domain-containing protein, partial [Pedobacter sp.]
SNKLQIRSGLFFNKTVSVESIRKIVETRMPMSSPAMSLDRLEVFYNKFDSVIISPKEKNEFIEQIRMINDRIEVISKESASH